MWQFFIGLGIALIATFAIRPKPQNVRPSGINEIEVPTAEEGREIPVLFGSRDISGANVVWYGDLRTTPIKTKSGKK